jgi:ATP synthase protein I
MNGARAGGPSALRAGLAATAAVGAVVAVVAVAVAGGGGLAGAALGTAVVGAFFAASKVAVGLVARRAPALLLPAALGTYLVKILALGILLVSLRDTAASTLDVRWLAWSVLAGVVGWMAAEVWVATHTRVAFYDPAAFRARHGEAADRPPVGKS